jgi:hypothetical protein
VSIVELFQALNERGFNLDDISIGGKSAIGANDTTKGRVIIDTGVSHLSFAVYEDADQ